MARPLRIEYPGAGYHITSRGNARQAIFLADQDRADFLAVVCFVAKRFNWVVHAYCLMSNHYHVLLETPEGNLSRGMRQLNGLYTQRFNRRHKQVGTFSTVWLYLKSIAEYIGVHYTTVSRAV